MAVKQLQSLQRGLTVLETIAAHHPIGLTDLARLLGEDKSALQRVLATLHSSGWIAPSRQDSTKWSPTSRPLLVTSRAQERSGMLLRIRPLLDRLRDQFGETVFYVVPEGDQAVIIEVAQSREISRVAPHPGITLPYETSAAGTAMDTAGRWTTDRDSVGAGTTSVAIAVVESGQCTGAIVVSAPTGRMPAKRRDEIGRELAEAVAAFHHTL